MKYLANIPAMATATRMKIPKSLRDELVDLAGEQCAICHRMLREFDKESGKTKHIADTAHIYPVSDRGERGDPARRPVNVDDISNLVLLCPYCHRLIDWQGVGGRLWPIDKLLKHKREHEAWVTFQRARPPEEVSEERIETTLTGLEPGTAVSAGGQSYRLPWEPRPERLDGAFSQEWSPEQDAVRSQSYAYAETGEASHVWLRRVVSRNGSTTGARWRRELIDEASLLTGQLPRLPGLPDVLAVETTPTEAIVVTTLPTTMSMQDAFGGTAGKAAGEKVRALFSCLPTLCSALGALHDVGLAHGALDPATILVDKQGGLALRDLGYATQTSQTTGPAKSADVIALASIIYECLTGIPPLLGDDGPPVLATAHNPAVPADAASTLTRALAGDIADARAFARQLRSKPTPATQRR
jgi:HNH endonuclease